MSCRASPALRMGWWFLLCAVLALSSSPVWSGQRPWTLERYRHVAWTGKNGAPTGVAALAQTSDGYLWIGTDHGLYHFDGIRFERFEPATSEALQSEVVSALFASRDGGLWVGYEAGGVSLLMDGHLRHYKPCALSRSMVIGFSQDGKGNIWEWNGGGPGETLFQLSNGHWQPMSTRNGLDGHAVTTLHIARDGSFWVGTTDGLFYRPAGSTQFHALANDGYVGSIAQAPDGSIWVAKLRGRIQRWMTAGGTPVLDDGALATSSTGVIAFDEFGGLWIGGLGDGLRHLVVPTTHPDLDGLMSHLQLFDASTGLSNDYVWPLMEDREGNIWVGTSAGLDRFSRSNFTPAPFPSGTHDFALAPGADGSLWTGSSSKPVMRLDGATITSFDVPPFTLAAYGDGAGTVLIGGQSGIWRMTGAGAEHLASLPLTGRHLVAAMVEDHRGTLWISITGRQGGLFSWVNGSWTRLTLNDTPRVEYVDKDGKLWLGYSDDKLIIRDGGDTTTGRGGRHRGWRHQGHSGKSGTCVGGWQ
jgi:ligand-binding sensor domain-containing protein